MFNWALRHPLRFKRWDTRENVFSFTFAFVSCNSGLIFAKIFSKNWELKTLLDISLRVLGSLQAGRSTPYLAIIETPAD